MVTVPVSAVRAERVGRGRLHVLLSLAVAFLLLASCASTGKEGVSQGPRNADWATPIQLAGVPNLHKVNDNLYRSAQPTDEGIRNLEKMGIKTIINLREFHDDKDEARGSIIKRVDIPMAAWDIKDDQVVEALRQIDDRGGGPYLVHCLHGADRTGVVNALFRIVHDNWDKQRALDEMKNGGYGFHPVWTNIVDYVAKADVEKIKRQVSAR